MVIIAPALTVIDPSAETISLGVMFPTIGIVLDDLAVNVPTPPVALTPVTATLASPSTTTDNEPTLAVIPATMLQLYRLLQALLKQTWLFAHLH